MADTETPTGTILQTWVSPKLAREIKELADRDGRSVSNLIKLALRDRLSSDTSGEVPVPLSTGSGGRPGSSPGPRRSADARRETP